MTAATAAPGYTTTLDTALWIASEWPGARVFPTIGKEPAHREVKSWKDDATTDPDLITAWYTGTNYGIGVTGILTIDSDLPDNGAAARAKWGSALDAAVTWCGHPNRRSYAYAQTSPATGDGKWLTVDGKPGGEVKGSGYVVVPPSPHVSSECPDCARGEHAYRWLQAGGVCNPLTVWPGSPLAGEAREGGSRVEVPDQWLTSGEPCQYMQRLLDGATDWTPGGRHTTMTDRQLRMLRAGEQGHAGARKALAVIYDRFMKSVGNDLGRARVAREEYRRALEGAAGEIVRVGFTDPLDYHCCAPADVSHEAAVFGATDILDGIRQAARAGSASPWTVLGGTLALVAAHTPHTYCLPGRGSLNLFVGFVGPSGVGKSTGWGVANRHLNIDHGDLSDVNTPHALPVATPTGEGILAAFMHRNPSDDPDARKAMPYVMRDQPNVVVHVDEIDQLSASSNRAGSTVEPILRSLWSGSAVGTQTADTDRRRYLPDSGYRLAMAVGIQPAKAGHLLSRDAQDTGTAQRWLWMPAIDPDATEDVAEILPLTWRAPFIPWSPHGGSVRIVAFPAAVMAQVSAERRARLRGEHVGMDSHATMQRMKVAAALAMLHGMTEVNDEMWVIAGHIMEVSDDTRTAAMSAVGEAARERAESEGRRDNDREVGAWRAQVATGAATAGRIVERHHLAGRHDGTGCPGRCFQQGLPKGYRELWRQCVERAESEGLVVANDRHWLPPVGL